MTETATQVDVSDIRKNLVAILSLPRFGPLDPMFDLSRSSSLLGITLKKRNGPYWGQSLTRVMEAALSELDAFPPDDNKCILTIDYDTPHEFQDIVRLYGMLKAAPEADAICALQSRRECREMLIAVRGDDGEMLPTLPGSLFDGRLVKVARGHFGLTVIRASSLRDFPRPWFLPIADAEGRWGPDRTDEDVGFWINWEKTGRNLYCAHEVTVSHIEMVRTWPGKNGMPFYQSMSDYDANGKPAAAWGER